MHFAFFSARAVLRQSDCFFLPIQTIDDKIWFEPEQDVLEADGISVEIEVYVVGQKFRFKFPNEMHEIDEGPVNVRIKISQDSQIISKVRFLSLDLFSAVGKTDLLPLVSDVGGMGNFDGDWSGGLRSEDEERLSQEFKETHALSFSDVKTRRMVKKDLPSGGYIYETTDVFVPMHIKWLLLFGADLPIDLDAEDYARIDWTAEFIFADGTKRTLSRSAVFSKMQKSIKMYHPIFNRHQKEN